MRSTFNWVALIVAGVALLIAAVGAILALLAGHARFIEVAWISIAASYLFWHGQASSEGNDALPAQLIAPCRWVASDN
jgi:hypothetical protein